MIGFKRGKNRKDRVRVLGEIAGGKDKAKRFMAEFNKKGEGNEKRVKNVMGKDERVGVYERRDKGEMWILNENWGGGGEGGGGGEDE